MLIAIPFEWMARPRRSSAGQGDACQGAFLARLAGERVLVALGAVPRAIDAADAAVAQPEGEPNLGPPGEVEELVPRHAGALLARPGVGNHTGGDRRAAGAAVGQVAGGDAPQRRVLRAFHAHDPACAHVADDR